MADYTSLAIGINRYQYIQPLSYAQDDAQAIHQLLVEETELPPEQALMLTDASPWVYNHPTEPTRDNINHWIEQWLPSQPTTLLWFFFSGYGVNWQGEDYLMPIDGNPADIPGTAIRIQDLAAKMQQAGFENILMLLDINRSPGVIAGQTVGGQIAELAPEKGISLVLSSQIEEASHEAVALGHGMFTAALLEGLRYYGAETTLDNLSRYLYDRLPELSEHHWRPMQHPLIIIPSIEFAQESLLPRQDGAIAAETVATPAIAPSNVVPLRPPILDNGEELPAELMPDPLPEPTAELTESSAEVVPEPSLPAFGATPPPPGVAASVASELKEPHSPPEVVVPVVAPPPEPQPIAAPPVPQPLPSQQQKPTQGQQTWLLWGGGTILLLALLGLLQFFRGDRPDPVVEVPSPSGEPTEPTEPNATTVPPTTDPNPTVAAPTAEQAAPATGTLTLEESQAILARARTLIQSNQASGFSEAIAEANKIPPNAPLYAEAQGDMARWSQVIVDIARGRANQGDFDSAIAAAQLVPEHQATAHQAAQQQIAQWQALQAQQQQNSEIIRTARRQIRYTQASSYSKGILTLSAIPADQPGYLQAQDLIGRWSKQIYLIANSRAARKEYQQAIETARLVPQGTLEYDNAQKAIARWQQGKP